MVLKAGGHFEQAVLGFLTPPPGGVKWLVTIVWVLGSVGLIVLSATVALLARRPAMARDVALAGGVAWGLSYLIEVLVGPDGARLAGTNLAHVNLHFPQPRVAVAVAVATAAVPYLVRGLERVIQLAVLLAALATLVHGAGLLTSVLASIALGWGLAAAVHLIFGTPLGLPSGADVSLLLEEMGLGRRTVVPEPDQEWGVARYSTSDDVGPLVVSVYGRDARDAQFFAKTFRYVFYRDSGPTLTITRLQQVEHEAYLTLLAGSHGATVPTVVDAARVGPNRDAVLVVRSPKGVTLTTLMDRVDGEEEDVEARGGEAGPGVSSDPDGVFAPAAAPAQRVDLSDGAVHAFLTQLVTLGRARIAHGSISADTVVVDGDNAGLIDFSRSSYDATKEQIDRDLACALATLSLAIGSQRTASAAARCLPSGAVPDALPYLGRAALSPALVRQYRGRKSELVALREQGAAAAGVEVPKLAEPRRLSWVSIALIVGSLIGGWALLGVLVNVGNSFDTIVGADWGWVVTVAVLAGLVYPSLAFEILGSVNETLPYGRVLALEMAETFVGLAGGTMAVIATRVRFFQQQGLATARAISSGVLITSASWITKLALFLLALPFALGTLRLDDRPAGGGARTAWLIAIAVVVIGVLVGAVLAVPRLRRVARDKLRPKLSDVTGQLKMLAGRPRKLVALFGGAVAAQICVILALGASLQAFGDHLSPATLMVIIFLAGILGGASPVPGGVGVVEAGLILGLTSAGVTEEVAVAAVFVQRLFTSYLPPVAGWIVLVGMRRKEYL
ncbi:MAG: flippase-like domain-containing protein [Acidimicrobiales bacterium]|nr:flippase-like domain-containing protein [Acidimicrobiales bacterium]